MHINIVDCRDVTLTLTGLSQRWLDFIKISELRMIVARFSRKLPLMFPQPLALISTVVSKRQNRAEMVMACGHVTKAISYDK